MVRLEQKIESFALQTRLIVLFFQVIFNAVIPDHDAGVFNPPVSPGHNSTMLDNIADFGLGGLRRWDGVYLMHIAEYGYTYENAAAFFPLFPITVGKIADFFYCFSFAGQIMSKLNICMILGVAFNVYFFTKASSTLFSLGVRVLRDEKLAYSAALLFCINPASVFMTAPYTEPLFAYLLFSGLLALSSGCNIKAAIWFGFGTLTRSNGLVAMGFILYKQIKELYLHARFRIMKNTLVEKILISMKLIPTYLVPVLLPLAICAVPFLAYQFYIYRKFCFSIDADVPLHLIQYGRLQGYVLPSDVASSWCSQLLPLSYSYIQREHWGMGFLRYFQLKQIPNFLLAAPMLALSVYTCLHYYRLNPVYCQSLGMVEGRVDKKLSVAPERGFQSRQLFVYVAHLVFLTIFGFFFMHIQVLTRFLASSSPVIYWFAAHVITSHEPVTTKSDFFATNSHQVETPNNLRTTGKGNLLIDQINNFWQQGTEVKLLLFYFMFYFVVGTAAFSNFLPWT